jgi:ketosteroid isomerase-like protein
LNPEEPKPDPANDSGPARENVELDDFFQRLSANFRWPKPSPEAMAAAAEAIQRLSGGSGADDTTAENAPAAEDTCAACDGLLLPGARFCVWCGRAKDATTDAGSAPPTQASAQHHYHHHYHHFLPGSGSAARVSSAEPASATPRGKASGSAASGSRDSRAEVAVRQVAQDWAQACNIKHLDDLLELYSADATVIRASLPPVRSLAAIHEFLFSLLEAGLGEVEMESFRTDVMGEVALDLGRCKMLVPVAMGKRREERGKYLLVLVRQPSGTWKILADCWSSDLAVSASPAPEPSRKGSAPSPPERNLR